MPATRARPRCGASDLLDEVARACERARHVTSDERGEAERGPHPVALRGVVAEDDDAEPGVEPVGMRRAVRRIVDRLAEHDRVERLGRHRARRVERAGGDVAHRIQAGARERRGETVSDRYEGDAAHGQSARTGCPSSTRPVHVRRMSVVGAMTWAARASRRYRCIRLSSP